jgi:ATP/maltotriose-dependent transcriptional regulator MalT
LTELLRGQYSRCLHWADLAASRCVANPIETARVSTIRGIAFVDTGRYPDGIDVLQTGLDSVPVETDPHTAAYALSMLGKAHLLQGDLTAAIAALDRAVELARVHWIAFQPWPQALRAEVALRCGQLDRAGEMFQQAYTLARNFEHTPCWEKAAERGLGLVAAANGAVDKALAWFDDAYRCPDREAATYQWVHCNALDSLCELAITNSLPGAPAWLAEFEELSGRFGMHGFLARSAQHRDRLTDVSRQRSVRTLTVSG